MRMPNRAMLGMVWTRFRVCRTGARRFGRRWHRMPKGRPIRVAAAKEPADSTTWRSASRQKMPAREAYSRMAERSFQLPDQNRAPTSRAATSRAAIRATGSSRSLASASVTRSARARPSSQNALPSATRAYLSPAGTSQDAPWRTASASAIRPVAPAGSRTRVLWDSSTTAPIATSSRARSVAVSGGNAVARECGSPEAIRLALNTSNGANRAANTPTVQARAPSRSIRRAVLSGAAAPTRMPVLAMDRLVGHEAFRAEIDLRHVVRGLAAELDAGVEFLQGFAGQAREYGLERVGDLGIGVEDHLADDRCRCVDRLHALVVLEHHQAGRADAAIGAVDHGGVGAVRLIGGGLDGGRGVAARQHDQLLGL